MFDELLSFQLEPRSYYEYRTADGMSSLLRIENDSDTTRCFNYEDHGLYEMLDSLSDSVEYLIFKHGPLDEPGM